MTVKPMFLTLLAAVLLMSVSPIQAQDPTQQLGQDEAEQQKQALQNKAYRLLDQIIDESQSLRLPENRIRIQINAADLIWDRDQGRARSLFMQASEGVTELMRSTPTSQNQRGPQPERRWFSLRQELVMTAARHDAPLAYQLLAATKQQTPATPPSGDARNPRVQLSLDDNLEQSLLARVAALDPKLAAQNAEQMMDKGQFPRTIGDVINQLRNQDSEAASKLAEKTVKRIQSANLLTSTEAGSLAQTLLNPGPRVVGTKPDSSTQTTQVRGPVLDQSAYTDLLSTVIDAALKATPGQQTNQRAGARAGAGSARVVTLQANIQSTDVQTEQNNARRLLAGLQVTLPAIDQYLPSRANAVRQKLTELGITDSSRMNFGQSLNAIQQQGNVTSDALMQVAATASGPMQSMLYQQAAVRALDEGNTDRARQIANDYLQAGPRDSVMQRIDVREMAKKAQGAQLDEIRQSLARLSSESDKVSLLLQLAAGDLQKDNPKVQLQMLDEAKQIISHRATNYDQFEDQLRVARAFSAVDPARSFEVLEPGISQLNELLSAASVLSGFEINVFRDGEMLMSGQGGSGLSNTINRFGQELAVLAKTDFERSEILASRFQFTEPRIMTRMSIVQGALGVQSSTTASPPNIFRNVGGVNFVSRP